MIKLKKLTGQREKNGELKDRRGMHFKLLLDGKSESEVSTCDFKPNLRGINKIPRTESTKPP